MKETRLQAKRQRVKRRNRNATKPVRKRESASTGPKAKQVAQAEIKLIKGIFQLEMWVHQADLRVGRRAFEALSDLFHELLSWLYLSARLSPATLGALSRQMPEDDAWARYQRGEHAAAWAGVELARLYKRIKAHLASRSKNSINPLRDLLCGFKLAGFDSPPNDWFRREYESKRDYRPTGRMAVWIARKIEEIRRVKTGRSQWRSYASIEIAKDGAKLRPQLETEDILAARFRSEIVQGAPALKRLDDLPRFGDPDTGAVKAWQSFVRRQVLTQNQIITEFETLFPKQCKKLDGVITATLCSAWRAVQGGGDVILPEH